MVLNGELVGFFYEVATNSPVWAATDISDFMLTVMDQAVEKGLIDVYNKMELDIMLWHGEGLDNKEEIIKELQKMAPAEYYARKNGNWGEAYASVVRQIKNWQKESGDPRVPKWWLNLEDIALRAAKWALEDAINQIVL